MKTTTAIGFYKRISLIVLMGIVGCSATGASGVSEEDAKVMKKGRANWEQMQGFLQANNPELSPEYCREIAKIYIEESAVEGVNHDIAFAQMCHETNFLKFGGQVLPEQNNFAGLGATDNGARGAQFPDKRIGVRAQIQHLKAYASKERPAREIVDPRFSLVKRGSATTFYDLTGKWATDPEYGKRIEEKMEALYQTPTPRRSKYGQLDCGC